MKTITYRDVHYKIVSCGPLGVVVELPERAITGNHSRMEIPWKQLTLRQLRDIKKSDWVCHDDTKYDILKAITSKQKTARGMGGSTPTREKLPAAPSIFKANLKAKKPWRQEVKKQIKYLTDVIRQDRKDMKCAAMNEEYEVALRIQTSMEEKLNMGDDLEYLLDNCV